MKRLALVLVLSSCSWSMSQRPEPARPCKPSYAGPALDIYMAIGAGAVGLAAVSDDESSASDTRLFVALASGIASAMHSGSAAYGFKVARACRDHAPPAAGYWVVPPPVDVPAPAPQVIEEVEEIDEVEIHRSTRRTRTIVVP